MRSEQAAPPLGVVVACDVAEGVPSIAAPRAGVLVRVRVFSEPIGLLSERLPAEGRRRTGWGAPQFRRIAGMPR
jgi:hypothetical protein